MHLRKILANNSSTLLFLTLFTFVFFATRLFGLNIDEINPDAVNWHFRAEQFAVALKSFNFANTYQHYHPGVTLMWLMAGGIELLKQFTSFTVYNHETFIVFHVVSKVLLITTQYFLFLFCYFLLRKIWRIQPLTGFTSPGIVESQPLRHFIAGMFIIVLSVEPFFLGNSRLLHLDALFTLFMFISLCYCYLAFNKKVVLYFLLAGFFSGLSILTKSVGIGIPIFFVAFSIFWAFLRKEKIPWRPIIYFCISCLVTLFVFFPALWVAPLKTIYTIFDEAERVGVRKGHEQLFFGSLTFDPGPSFYPVVLALKFSPFILGGIVLYLLTRKKLALLLQTLSFTHFSGFFYLGYFVVMSISSKKLDRYMLVLFPFFILLSLLGYFEVYTKLGGGLRRLYVSIVAVSFVVFIFYPLVKLYPYYFIYTSPLFGNAASANRIIAQKPFGIGIAAVRDSLLTNYGTYPTVGMYDTKPLRSIYMNSRLFDVREYGANRYDIIVLALNEEFPVSDSGEVTDFRLTEVVKIGDLDYWRIYVKSVQ